LSSSVIPREEGVVNDSRLNAYGLRCGLLCVVVLGGSVVLVHAGETGFGLGLDQMMAPAGLPPSTPSHRSTAPVTLPVPEIFPWAPPRVVEQPPGFPGRLRDDLAALAVAPLDWEAADWRKLGLGVLVVGAVSLADEPIADWIAAHPNSGARKVALAIRPLGQEGGLAVAGGAWLAGHFTDRPDLEAVGADSLEATLIAAGVITPLLKAVVGRQRPHQADQPEWVGTRGESFPSGETTEAFAIASVVAAHSDRAWVKATAWGLASLVGLQRMELDAHYASDVLAGALIGTAVARWVVKRNRPDIETGPQVSVAPMVGSQGYGMAMSISF
jgi:membrane-associated phospholipid phosphatase